MAAAGPTNEFNRLWSLLLRRQGPPMDEMTKGLFVPGRKIGKRSAQKVGFTKASLAEPQWRGSTSPRSSDPGRNNRSTVQARKVPRLNLVSCVGVTCAKSRRGQHYVRIYRGCYRRRCRRATCKRSSGGSARLDTHLGLLLGLGPGAERIFGAGRPQNPSLELTAFRTFIPEERAGLQLRDAVNRA